jgi:alkylated DNA repair dioxygenase AlkB
MQTTIDLDFASREIGMKADPGSDAFENLWQELPLEKRVDAPRFEAWFSDSGVDYGYGRGAGFRVYRSNAKTPSILAIKNAVERVLGCAFEGCFVNGYRDGRDHLGWHADDSPEMDDARPIAIVSFGGERALEFRLKDGAKDEAMTRRTASGSLIVMPAGFQDLYEHRIAKAGLVVAPRLSFTFRGVVDNAAAAAA